MKWGRFGWVQTLPNHTHDDAANGQSKSGTTAPDPRWAACGDTSGGSESPYDVDDDIEGEEELDGMEEAEEEEGEARGWTRGTSVRGFMDDPEGEGLSHGGCLAQGEQRICPLKGPRPWGVGK